MAWDIKIMRFLVLFVLIIGVWWTAINIRNVETAFAYGPLLQWLFTMLTILIVMPVLVLYSTSEKFVARWWDKKGQRILLVLYLLLALGYAVKIYWVLIIAAS